MTATDTDLDVTIEHLAAGTYLLRWRCSELCRGSDLVVADDRAPDRWQAIADVRVPGTPAPTAIAGFVAAATTAHSGCAAAASRTPSRSS